MHLANGQRNGHTALPSGDHEGLRGLSAILVEGPVAHVGAALRIDPDDLSGTRERSSRTDGGLSGGQR